MDNTKHVPYGLSIENRHKVTAEKKKKFWNWALQIDFECAFYDRFVIAHHKRSRKIKGFSVRVRGYEVRFNTPDHLDRVLWRWMLLKKVRSSFRRRDYTTPLKYINGFSWIFHLLLYVVHFYYQLNRHGPYFHDGPTSLLIPKLNTFFSGIKIETN